MEMCAKQERKKNLGKNIHDNLGAQKRNINFPFGSLILFKEKGGKNCLLLNSGFLDEASGSTFSPILSHSSKNQTRSHEPNKKNHKPFKQ